MLHVLATLPSWFHPLLSELCRAWCHWRNPYKLYFFCVGPASTLANQCHRIQDPFTSQFAFQKGGVDVSRLHRATQGRRPARGIFQGCVSFAGDGARGAAESTSELRSLTSREGIPVWLWCSDTSGFGGRTPPLARPAFAIRTGSEQAAWRRAQEGVKNKSVSGREKAPRGPDETPPAPLSNSNFNVSNSYLWGFPTCSLSIYSIRELVVLSPGYGSWWFVIKIDDSPFLVNKNFFLVIV